MISALVDLLSIMATWLGLGVVVTLGIGLKAWQLVVAHRREKRDLSQ